MTEDNFNLLTLSVNRLIPMIRLGTALIASGTCSNSTWIRKTLGIIKHLVLYIKTTLPYSDLRISTQLLLSPLLDRRMRACTRVMRLEDFGIACVSVPLREGHLKCSLKILLSTLPAEKNRKFSLLYPTN